MILSQTYFKEINKEKIYLQRGIISNPLFNNIKFWEGYINYSIQTNTPIKNYSKIIIEDESPASLQTRKQLGFEKVMSSIYNMMAFKVEKKVIIEIIDIFCKSCDLNSA